MSPSLYSPAYPSRRLELLTATLGGLVAFLVAIAAPQVPLKLLFATVLGAGVIAAAIASRQPKSVLLGAWVITLTYNRVYFVFEPIVGYEGGQGPYIIVSDVFLFLLLGMWFVESIARKQLPKPRGGSMWIWVLPFALAGLISVLQSRRPDWGFYELWRYVKLILVLLYFRYQVGKREWWACIVALMLAVFFQGALSVAEIASGKSGVLGVLGVSSTANVPAVLSEEVFLGWHRATATMSHPPQLACYFIFMNPILFGLAYGTRNPRVRLPALGIGIIGMAGLACTLSRWPNTLMIMELTLLLSGLVAMRLANAKQVIASAVLALLAAGIVAFTFRDFIVDRLFRDLDRSIQFREKDDTTGLRVARDHPWFGVGLNNYHDYLLEYEPDWEWAVKYEKLGIEMNHTRPIASPHSAYLLILAETGGLGFLAFLWLLFGILKTGVRATYLTRGRWRVICYALTVGLVGHYLQQIVDFSMVFDPLLYSLAMVWGLLLIAPDLYAAHERALSPAKIAGVSKAAA